MTSPFTPAFETLPQTIPIFPLTGAIVLPDAELPLNVFEPRYLAMVGDAIRTDRIIGMIQPSDVILSHTEESQTASDEGSRDVAAVGAAGRITSFQETRDGRMIITLTGLCRYRIVKEMDTLSGYRRVQVDWSEYRSDMSGTTAKIDVNMLLAAVNTYLSRRDISADIQSTRSSSPSHIINTLSMHLPFDPLDKQSLLEASDDTERGVLLMGLCRATSEPTENTKH